MDLLAPGTCPRIIRRSAGSSPTSGDGGFRLVLDFSFSRSFLDFFTVSFFAPATVFMLSSSAAWLATNFLKIFSILPKKHGQRLSGLPAVSSSRDPERAGSPSRHVCRAARPAPFQLSASPLPLSSMPPAGA